MTKPTVAVNPRVADCYGKSAAELQSNIVVNSDSVAGTLLYVNNYTGFNASETIEQSGNFLALDFSANPTDSEVTVQLVGGTKGPVRLTYPDDMFCVFRITSKDTQSIKVTAVKDGQTTEKVYSLAKLTLQPSA